MENCKIIFHWNKVFLKLQGFRYLCHVQGLSPIGFVILYGLTPQRVCLYRVRLYRVCLYRVHLLQGLTWDPSIRLYCLVYLQLGISHVGELVYKRLSVSFGYKNFIQISVENENQSNPYTNCLLLNYILQHLIIRLPSNSLYLQQYRIETVYIIIVAIVIIIVAIQKFVSFMYNCNFSLVNFFSYNYIEIK